MTTGQGSKELQQMVSALAERCGVLRLVLWCMCAVEDVLVDPMVEGAASDWLRTSSIHKQVTSQIEDWLSREESGSVELEPGCWLFGELVHKHRRLTGIMVGITFESRMFHQAWFTQSCEAAGTDPAAVRESLLNYTWPGEVDPTFMTSVFRRTVKDHMQAQADRTAIDQFSEQLLDTYEQTNLLFNLARLMNNLHDPIQLIPTCCQQVQAILPFRWIAAKFWEHGHPVKGLTGRLVVVGKLPCDQAQFERVVVDQFAANKTGNWKKLLERGDGGVADLVGSEVIVESIMHDGEVVGVLIAGNKCLVCPIESDVTSGELKFIEATSNMMGVFHENIARFDEQQQMFKGTVRALTAAIDAKDPYTRGHSERVAYMAARLAEAMGMTPPEVERVHTTGLVHDVGKIGVPGSVLCKPGRLTDEEFELIKRHPEIGYNILKGIPALESMLPGVLHHHERFDGKGYPHRLAGEDIPLIGRILALADTFDAMSSTRSYRPALPRPVVIEEIRNCAGSQFDPKLAPLFVTLDFAEYDRLVEQHRSLSAFAA